MMKYVCIGVMVIFALIVLSCLFFKGSRSDISEEDQRIEDDYQEKFLAKTYKKD